MRSSFKIFCIWFLLIIVGCKTNPPTTPESFPEGKGWIFINSNIPGADIFLNNIYTGRTTPDTIEVIIGNHNIRLEKTGFASTSQEVTVLEDSVITVELFLQPAVNKVVLVEDFANVSCIPCATSNKIIDQLINKSYGTAKLVGIKYHTNFPHPNDPFYVANKPDGDARRQYYMVNVAPSTFIDGIHKPVSTDSNSIKEKIEEQLAKSPQFNVEVSGNISGSQYNVNVEVTLLDPTGIDFSNIIIHTIVTETNIEFASPPGSNGETKFFDIMRMMLPSNQGASLSNIQQNQTLSFQYPVTINPGWDPASLNIVSFVQNKQTKEVYQTGSTF